MYSELSISGMHRSLAKQDACTANVNLEILAVNETPLSRISVRNLQTFVYKSDHYITCHLITFLLRNITSVAKLEFVANIKAASKITV
jgi:hypothetical protein